MSATATVSSSSAEVRRIRNHLLKAERLARSRKVSLNPLQAFLRALLLDELARYRKQGCFPHNHRVPGRKVPVFVDEHGTHCAVGHLMAITGQKALVRRVARSMNLAKVRELAVLPELGAWLAAAGLSLEEAAAIQPSYCFYSQADQCFCNGTENLSSVALATVLGVPEEYSLRVRIDRVEGASSEIEAGDELELSGQASVGDSVLVGLTAFDADAGFGGEQFRLGPLLSIEEETVLCSLNAETRDRPVSLDTVIEGMLAGGGACIDTFASDDSGWNRSQCEGDGPGRGELIEDDGDGNGPARSQVAGDEGCSLALLASSADAGISTASLLLAVLAFRYRRRQQAPVRRDAA